MSADPGPDPQGGGPGDPGDPEHLKRTIGPWLLMAYGIGVMVGAGIYVLIGAVAGQAGLLAPLAFALAGLIAVPTALSYSEFSSRLPEAAGEALYVAAGLRRRDISLLVGLAIVMVGTVSAAAVLRGGVGYLTLILDIPEGWAIALLGLGLVGVAVAGALESLALAALFTLIELGGLLLVAWAGLTGPQSVDFATLVQDGAAGGALMPWAGLVPAAVLAFFAFIGFEDMVNLAEEVEDPRTTMPRAILGALAVTSVLYALVAFAAIRAVPVEMLAGSDQPLALVWQLRTGEPARFLSGIAVVAALNGVLAQVMMAARVLYGLGQHFPTLGVFHHASRRFGTPVLATLLVGAVVIAGALTLPVAALAEFGSITLLIVFCLVNLSLLALRRRQPDAPFRVHGAVPVLGLVLSATALFLALLA